MQCHPWHLQWCLLRLPGRPCTRYQGPSQVDLERITMIGLTCTADERDECRCAWPYPTQIEFASQMEPAIQDLIVKTGARKTSVAGGGYTLTDKTSLSASS